MNVITRAIVSGLVIGAIGATGCSLAVPSTGPTVVYMGKLKGPPVSDVAPTAIPTAYEAPDVLPPKEPAINVLARAGERRGGS